MKFILKGMVAGLALALTTGALLSVACHDDHCNLSGYTPMVVTLVAGEPVPPTSDGGCTIYTDLMANSPNPDAEGDKLRHIGESIYQCLTGTVPSAHAPEATLYQERLNFRLDGQCPEGQDGFTYYGCFSYECRTVDTELAHIGPAAVCPRGQPMVEWSEACWSQFYTVLGHEVVHGWLGGFH